MRLRRLVRGVQWVAALSLLLAPAYAQDHPATAPSVPPIPSGPGTLEGLLRHADGADRVAGLDIILYALMADGTPGMSRATTNGEGRFTFEGISNASDTVFLVAARYSEIPFGGRFTFAPGQLVHELAIDVSDPVASTDSLRVTETLIHLEAGGPGAQVRVEHQLRDEGGAVVYVDESARATAAPLFETALPAEATGFSPITMSLGEGFERRGDRLLFWGPLYPDGQALRYTFLLPASGRQVRFVEPLPLGAERVVVTVPEGDTTVHSEVLAEGDAIERDGRKLRAWTATGLGPGERVALDVTLPDMRRDASAFSLREARLWLELDDTNLVVTEEISFEVEPGSQLMGSADQPLLRIALPEGAEVMGASQEMSALGAVPAAGGFEVVGPLSPGEGGFSYRYRLPSDSGGTELARSFGRDLPVLHVFVADTGVVIESDRLHRLRPTRSGTRIYLHREAFQVRADETVVFRLSPIVRDSMPRAASLGIVVLLGLASAWLVVAPLRGARGAPVAEEASEEALERALVYATIRDLDHDFETGKIGEVDYQQTRAALRGQAIELLRREREGVAPVAATAAVEIDAPKARFCPACGERAESGWKFCSHCGGALPTPEPARESIG